MIDDLQRFAEEVASNLSGRPINLAFNCLGISSDETSRMLREIGIDPDTTADGPSALQRVRRLFDSQRELIRARLLDQRNSAISYLRQSGFLEPGPRLVVDVGWKGSTQRALSRLTGLPATDIAGCYLGLLPQAMSAELNLDKARGYLFSFGHPKPRMDLILDGYVVPELFFSAPHGSVLNYVENDGRMEPVHAVEEEPGGSIRSQTSAAIVEHCLAEFDALDGILDGAWPNALDPLSALLDMEGLLSRPKAWEVEAINAIPFINGTGGEWNFIAANRMPFHQLIRQPQAAVRRFQNSPWRSGAVRISLPWPIPAMTFHEFSYRMERVRRIFKYG